MQKIIIDVFRSSSTIVAALHSGAESIKPVLSPEEGLKLGEKGYITVGEYKGKKLPGYDYHNSPSKMLELDLEGKKIAMCTTNGTLAILNSPECFIGCFMNAKYVSKLNAIPYPVGRLGKFAIEDDLCAHVILAERYNLNPDYKNIKENIITLGRKIPKEDLELCLSFNEYLIIPYYDGIEIRKLRERKI